MSIRTKLSTFNSQLSTYKFHFLIFFISILILSRFNFDPDLGWHLFYGKHFLETGQILSRDISSWTMPGYTWANSYFLYQILVAWLFENFHFARTVLVFGFIAAVSVVILLPQKINFWHLPIEILAVLISLANIGLRPHTISLLLFSFLVVFLDRQVFKKGYAMLVWFLLFALWANFHRGFLAGLIFLASFLILEALSQPKHLRKKRLIFAVGSIVAALLGTLLTPHSALVWKDNVFLDISSFENIAYVSEWQSPAIFFPANILMAFSGAIFAYLFFKKTAKDNLPYFISASFLFALAFISVNFAFFWAAIFIFISTRYFQFDFRISLDRLSKFFAAVISGCVILAFFLSFTELYIKSLNLQSTLYLQGYPAGAVSYLKTRNLDINSGLFNEYNWGGYLVWRQIPVFIDGRMASWRTDDKNILADYIDIAGGDCKVIAKYQIKLALIKKERQNPCFRDFKKIYEDDQSQILALPAMQ